MKLRDLVSALLKVAGMWALLETLMQAPATISTATYMSSQPGVSYPWIPVAALSVIRLAAIGILLFAGDRLAQIIVPADADTDVAGILSRPQAAFETGTRLTGVVVAALWAPNLASAIAQMLASGGGAEAHTIGSWTASVAGSVVAVAVGLYLITRAERVADIAFRSPSSPEDAA